ncbi:TetR/AcrR family transcriptional regulator [Mesorhizobium qingshengii]|uniref:Transcriptional regulator, TetR family n=1 Tax=Mesorhizobium qingshengii TaxID=1165689 RepID=A0A1G5Z9U2_9HYPH|nr:TetR family transcriptional regulator [Mesorhizobium qingshengii]SDA91412.1 transcriptional regulator, TetR family [Mesorhizobium qingshengii]
MPRKSGAKDPIVATSATGDETDTRERILHAANRLFAERGFDGATLREITEAARANLAAVNYYFRSKDELIRSTLESALKPIVAARLEALKACERAYPDRLPPLESLADALVRPMAELSSGENRDRLLLLLQVRTIAQAATNSVVADHFRPLHERFIDVLQKVLPNLSRAELALRYDCARGATLQILVDLAPAAQLVVSPAERATTIDRHEWLIAGLVQFVSAGLRAPPTVLRQPTTRKKAPGAATKPR